MRTTVIVGVKVTEDVGLSFFGVDEVNAALKAGKRVTALEPDGAFVQNLADGEGKARYTLSGFAIKVVVED